ncbi:hypothetical protein RIE95_09585 [Acidithiobacillus thiooxidans]|uniref:hypothetical protein n=1 Tax=Acidithiobacillus TaxID=119977 RepID=UPI0002DA7A7B|nr:MULTISPECIES: hypothetical protein [Acidithiobacillus]MBU2741821.1 hypothetical protein [Acidithiobacillus albertensis]MBU2812657.1 hypothetical protein [Acidithiobacillus thiooxidans]MBU2834869.1 hypothetical protein [Acidithiobacillus thiooxidans]MDR7927229.1 hypothetical protein [Acidithiobacillus thiooxidans]
MDVHIQKLQQTRHRLLNLRKNCGDDTVTIDLQLQVVRSTLHALYARQRRLKITEDPGE